MRKTRFYQAACVSLAILAAGFATGACAQSGRQASEATANSQAADPGKVVLKVGNVQVTEADVNSLLDSLSPQQKEQVERAGKQAVGEQYATMLVLSQAALSKHMDSSPEFKRSIQRERDQMLAQIEYEDLVRQADVSPTEISQFYSAHQDEFKQAKVHEVAILKRTASSTHGLTETTAQAKAAAIRKALASGEDIAKVAHEFNSPNEVMVRTDAQTIPNSPSLPEFAKAAFQLKPGALSEVNDRPDALIFYQVVDHSQESLEDATPAITGAIRQQKIAAALANLRKQTPVWLDPAYFGSGAGSPSTPAKP